MHNNLHSTAQAIGAAFADLGFSSWASNHDLLRTVTLLAMTAAQLPAGMCNHLDTVSTASDLLESSAACAPTGDHLGALHALTADTDPTTICLALLAVAALAALA
jgi:hypothetical protein